jgi:2-polyprenyl-3-methyl-5-hydroxy-6-metoxy-1,4-benzoquinol methylase
MDTEYSGRLFISNASDENDKERYLSSLGKDYGEFILGRNTTRILMEDPKLLLFTLARYKFVAKMFTGLEEVLEIGCHEGWGIPLVKQNVSKVHGTDFFVPYIESCNRRFDIEGLTFSSHDILEKPLSKLYDGVFALDVLEHIDPNKEERFMGNAVSSLKNNGRMILGTPSLESQKYASPSSKAGHVNCKTGLEFKALMEKYFEFSVVFSMNDEVLHTGFLPMSQYVFGFGAIPRK